MSALVNRVTSVIANLNPKQTIQKQQLDSLQQSLLNLKLPYELRKRTKVGGLIQLL